MRKLKTAIGFLWLCLALTGCYHYPANLPLAGAPNGGYRFSKLAANDNSDSLFVVLAFSGGGTRAASFSYGVLKGLKNCEITWKGKKKRLLDEVDLISSISGGSFTSAYYALFGEKIFSDFEAKFLKRNIQRELIFKMLNPLTMFKLASPTYDRIDMAAEIYDKTVFDRKSFAELLAQNHKPFLVVNATNLQLGQKFEFTQEQFDLIGSDLASVPLSRAVASSSAFPFLLSPLTIKNYGGDKSLGQKTWIVNALQDYNLNRRRYLHAVNTLSYLDAQNHPYIHLMDGGLSDNIGIQSIIDSIRDPAREGGIRQLINQGKIEELLLIVVNAKTQVPDPMDTKERAPGLIKVANKTATIAMDNYSFEGIESVRDIVDAREQAQRALEDCQRELDKLAPGKTKLPNFARKLKLNVIEIGFDSIPDQAERARFLSLPTSFSLKPDQVDSLIRKGEELLSKSEEFRDIINEFNEERR